MSRLKRVWRDLPPDSMLPPWLAEQGYAKVSVGLATDGRAPESVLHQGRFDLPDEAQMVDARLYQRPDGARLLTIRIPFVGFIQQFSRNYEFWPADGLWDRIWNWYRDGRSLEYFCRTYGVSAFSDPAEVVT